MHLFFPFTLKREIYIGSKGEKTYTGLMNWDLNKLIPKNIDPNSSIIASIVVFPDGNYEFSIHKKNNMKAGLFILEFERTWFTFKLGNDYNYILLKQKRPKTIVIK